MYLQSKHMNGLKIKFCTIYQVCWVVHQFAITISHYDSLKVIKTSYFI